MTPTLGFSIKSQLGGNSTLFNAGKTTNLTFSIALLKANIVTNLFRLVTDE